LLCVDGPRVDADEGPLGHVVDAPDAPAPVVRPEHLQLDGHRVLDDAIQARRRAPAPGVALVDAGQDLLVEPAVDVAYRVGVDVLAHVGGAVEGQLPAGALHLVLGKIE
jgi:hypothetical protein